MPDITRRIGLSLGADLCWPICFEEIVRKLQLELPIDGNTVRLEVERLSIEPFDLRDSRAGTTSCSTASRTGTTPAGSGSKRPS